MPQILITWSHHYIHWTVTALHHITLLASFALRRKSWMCCSLPTLARPVDKLPCWNLQLVQKLSLSHSTFLWISYLLNGNALMCCTHSQKNESKRLHNNNFDISPQQDSWKTLPFLVSDWHLSEHSPLSNCQWDFQTGKSMVSACCPPHMSGSSRLRMEKTLEHYFLTLPRLLILSWTPAITY